MQALFEAARTILNKSLPSWTVWLSVAWAIMSGLPDVLVTVVSWFGDVTPEVTAKVVAASLLVARLRSIAGPVIMGLLGKSNNEAG